MKILEAKNIHKIYNPDSPEPVHALKGVSFALEKGEFVALVGRSGSGKSTLLYQLALLDTPNEGVVFIDGVNVSKLSDVEKTNFRLGNIGYVFQDYALLPELTLFENVALPLVVSGMSLAEVKKKVENTLEKLGLAGLGEHLPSELSGGQKQRGSIARAIASEPKLLFADEPTANLDSISSKQVLEAFKDLNKKYGQTILMVTHEPEDEQYVDRVVELKDGVLKNQ